MPDKSRTSAKAKRSELERKLNDIRTRQTAIKERIYKLEASITAAPSMASSQRLHFWNTVASDEPAPATGDARMTRYQRRLVNKGRSRQAVTAFLLTGFALLVGLWLSYQLKQHGVL